MKEETKKWVAAGSILQKDAFAKVLCPVCGIGTLNVKDELVPNHPNKIDRYLICPNCGSWNVITIILPDIE